MNQCYFGITWRGLSLLLRVQRKDMPCATVWKPALFATRDMKFSFRDRALTQQLAQASAADPSLLLPAVLLFRHGFTPLDRAAVESELRRALVRGRAVPVPNVRLGVERLADA